MKVENGRHRPLERLVFEDNRLLPVLYGEQNAHLQKIEQALGVEIASRGNELVVTGRSAQQARSVLETLWGRILQGREVDTHAVDSVLRFMQDKPDDDAHKATGDAGSISKTGAAIVTQKKRIEPRTPLQARYMEALNNRKLVFGIGPAGTGKTYLAVAQAVAMMEQSKVERIILSRPAVEAGERIGFLPGELKEKMDPYMRPLYDALRDTMLAERVQKKLATEEIEIAPLAFMRGRTLSNAFIILDEAQNATPMQMLMFLTRMGENSRMVVTGDPSQTDLPAGQGSGLLEALDTLAGIEDIDIVRFSAKDVVRDKLVAKIVSAYDSRKKGH